jgi:hypothetical protein
MAHPFRSERYGIQSVVCYTYGVPEQDSFSRNTKTSTTNRITDVVQSVKEYALQETLGPLRGAGRWIGYGIAGAIAIGCASGFLALALLRMIQTEWPHVFQGRWMALLPYLFGLLWAIVVIALAISRINTQPLNAQPPATQSLEQQPLTKEDR